MQKKKHSSSALQAVTDLAQSEREREKERFAFIEQMEFYACT